MLHESPLNVFPELCQVNLTRGEPIEVFPGIGIKLKSLEPLRRDSFSGDVFAILGIRKVEGFVHARHIPLLSHKI